MTTTVETLFAPPDQELSPEWLDGCEESGGHYKVVPSVVCSMCCLFGIIYCFFGESENLIFIHGVQVLLLPTVNLPWFQAIAALKR